MARIPPKLLKRGKSVVVRVVMLVLGRAFQSASRWDPTVRAEAARWEEGFTILMRVPHGPSMGLEKKAGRLRHRGGRLDQADLTITFKNIDGAFLVCAGLEGAEQGFAEHRMSVQGDLPRAMGFIRCVNLLEAYLFPRLISRRILKRVPPMGLKRQGIRLAILCLGVPFGI